MLTQATKQAHTATMAPYSERSYSILHHRYASNDIGNYLGIYHTHTRIYIYACIHRQTLYTASTQSRGLGHSWQPLQPGLASTYHLQQVPSAADVSLVSLKLCWEFPNIGGPKIVGLSF